jgi:mannose-6-phosphate isomerase-like protein (cupin superfamily)
MSIQTSASVEDPLRRQRYSFRREGSLLHIDAWVEPGGDVPPHLHPLQEERFEVLEGSIRFRAGSDYEVAGPGERVTVPAGVVHAYENVGTETAHMRVEVDPALHLQDFLTEAAALARVGKYTRRGIPKGPRAALELMEFADRYGDETVLSFPPKPFQRLVVRPLAQFQRRRKRERLAR